VDRLEARGLQTRFFTLALIMLMLAADGGPVLCSIAAVLLVLVNMFFMISMLLLILGEMFQMCQGAPAPKVRPSGINAGAVMKALTFRVARFGLLGALKRLLAKLQAEKLSVEQHAPHFVWRGLERDIIIAEFEPEDPISCPRRLLHKLLETCYKLGPNEQRVFAASMVGQIFEHVITASQFSSVPTKLLHVIIVLPIAIKRMSERNNGKTPNHTDVAMEINNMLMDTDVCKECVQVSARTLSTRVRSHKFVFSDYGQYTYMTSPQDIAEALLYLQQLTPEATHLLLELSLATTEATATPHGQIIAYL